jgi:ATP-dependent helicase/nuclease subunit B
LSKATVEELYGEQLRLSASKLEKAASCRFAYFLQYGLKAKENLVAEVDASIYGTFVHDVLEKTSRQVMDEGGFHVVTLDRVIEIADQYMERFAREELADLWKSERAEYLFRRNFNELRFVVKRLYEELSVSAFAPDHFELEFSDGEDALLPGIAVIGDTVKGTLEGKVDRVDMWEHDGKVYYRVVDYKTGHTTFNYSGVYYGLGLQMLIYLFALKEFEGRLDYTQMSPSGVLYFPARCKSVSISSKDDETALTKGRDSDEKYSGLILDDSEVIQAMAPGDAIRYLPLVVKGNSVKGYLASTEDLELLKDHVKEQVSGLADSIYSGKLEPNPYYLDSGHYGCAWCPYKAICGDRVEQRLLDKLTPEMFWERIREERNG